MKPRNFEENLVWYSLVGVYVFYFLGGLSIWWSVVAWVLVGRLFWKLYTQDAQTPIGERVDVPGILWFWVGCMAVMELALLVGHADFDLGLPKILTSTINWAREWALLAIFPLIGCLNIRPEVLYRAACVVCLQSLLLIPLFGVGYALHLPATLYVSPLQYMGGNNPALYTVSLYQADPENGQIRLQLFTPWAPALGLVADIYFFLILCEQAVWWRRVGITGCLVMLLISASRLGILALPLVYGLVWLVCNWARPAVAITAGLASAAIGLVWQQVKELFDELWGGFNAARAASSRVRSTLGRLAIERWQDEAPLWGHGIIDPKGPKVVEFMPIGTHHTWYSLLFTKGIVGFAALAALFLGGLVILAARARTRQLARTALAVLLILFFYSFGENIDSLCYLCVPGLIALGMAFKERLPVPEVSEAASAALAQ